MWYQLIHTHRHGMDTFQFQTEVPFADLDCEVVAKALDVDYEADRGDEWLDLEFINLDKAPILTEANLHAAEVRLDAEEDEDEADG